MGLLRSIIGAIVGAVVGIGTFFGILILALLSAPGWMEEQIALKNIPFGQWTMAQLNAYIGGALLTFVAMVAAAFVFLYVASRVGDW